MTGNRFDIMITVLVIQTTFLLKDRRTEEETIRLIKTVYVRVLIPTKEG